jgi:hypothetical protein
MLSAARFARLRCRNEALPCPPQRALIRARSVARDEDGRKLVEGHDHARERVAKACGARRHHVAANQHVQIAHDLQCRGTMTVILPHRVLKCCPRGVLRQMLRPLVAVQTARNAPGICLGLEDDDRIETKHQVVDLRQATTVRQDDVVQRRRAQKRQLTRDGGLALLSGDAGLDLSKGLPLFVGNEVGAATATGRFRCRVAAVRSSAEQVARRAPMPPAQFGE